MIDFARPWLLLWAAGALVWAGLAAVIWSGRRRRAAAALADPALLQRIAPALARGRHRPVLWVLAAASLGLAAAGPLLGVVRESSRAVLPDVVLVLDASNSMRVEDVTPSRMEVQRRLARTLVGRLSGTRVGLVVFAGQGYVVSPLTRDGSALDAYLEALSPEMVPQGGSSLSHALRQGGGLLGSAAVDGEPPGALVLISDGDALEDRSELDDVARLLQRAAIRVHTVGVGTPGGGLVPDIDPESGERRGYKKEPDGRPARSVLGERLLRDLARLTGGSYSAAPPYPADLLVRSLYVDARPRDAWTEERPGNRYAWLVGIALVLLLADALSSRAPRRQA